MLLKEEHIDDELLEKKILDLFEYRLFPELIASKAPDFNPYHDIFYNQLKELQKRIYYLDAHLEAHAFPDNIILDKLWAQIYAYLSVLRVVEDDWPHYTRHIARYQKHELDLRKGRLPLRLDMEYFYYYKSCDVKLLRRLIYEKYQISGSFIKESDWKNYDLITEVNDDIADLFEDLGFINGNSFLISLLIKGKKNTQSTFKIFINKIKEATHTKLSGNKIKSSFVKGVNELTLLRCDETLTLLTLITEKIMDSELQHSLLNTKLLKSKIHEKSGY